MIKEKMTIISNFEKETFDFAKNFAKQFKGGEIIELYGNLGAGKTIFTKGLAFGIGIREVVNSPTFVIMKIYKIKKKYYKIKNLVHIDAYRINSDEDVVDIGIKEYFNRDDTIIIIEWAENIKKIISKKSIKIKIKIIDKNIRKIKINF